MKNLILFSLTLCLMGALSAFGSVTGVGKEPVLKTCKIVKETPFAVNSYDLVACELEEISILVLSNRSVIEGRYSFSHRSDHKIDTRYDLWRFSRHNLRQDKNLNRSSSTKFIYRGQRPIAV